MSQSIKQNKDCQFKPKDIRIRTTYRKLRPQIKDQMAKLYYIDKVKMSKIVKKYKISFSSLTDILKRYNLQTERLQDKEDKKSDSNSQLQAPECSNLTDKTLVKLEVKLEQCPMVFTQLHENDDTPQYIYYA